ncbi:MAG TPA: sugar phosphate isomerase/epimerase family protein [Bacillota bacterium]
MFRFGVRAHDFGKLPVEELAKRISDRGIPSIQLALGKAVAGLDAGPGSFSPGLARYIGDTFANHNIQIAVLGCYNNLIHPDPGIRRDYIARFKEHLRYARDFGCSVVGTETGSLNGDYSFHPDNHGETALRLFLESLTELVTEAEKFGVFVGIEGVASHVVSSPDRMKQVCDTIQSNNLQVILDPVNLLTVENYEDQDRILDQAFEQYGKRIVVLHLKDFTIEHGQKNSAPIGDGLFHFEYLLKKVQSRKPYINMLLEETTPETVAASIQKLQEIAGRV